MVVDDIRTQFCIQYPFDENLAFNEIMWKNMIEPGRPQMSK